jgi:nucleoside-diphosphate-sugar epimerase
VKAGAGKTRVLVTGATGFLGRNVLAAVSAREDAVAIAACRTPEKLAAGLGGEVRPGDLRDPGYRRAVVRGVDVVCHAGTWSSFWGHATRERSYFYEPARDLVEQAIAAGVRRFLLASTVAIAARVAGDAPIGDFAATKRTGFWPHLDQLVDLDTYMRENSHRGTQMVTMRLGHFVGAGNTMGVTSVLASRLRTRLVPWLGGGESRMAVVADTDLGEGFALAALANGLDDHESFNICGPEFPTTRELISFIAREGGLPKPRYSVPFPAGHAFGWLMERAQPITPGRSPFLTRSLVHLSRDWYCPSDYAAQKLGYQPRKDWRIAVREALVELRAAAYPWPPLAQTT